jgi:hypothetical protein
LVFRLGTDPGWQAEQAVEPLKSVDTLLLGQGWQSTEPVVLV